MKIKIASYLSLIIFVFGFVFFVHPSFSQDSALEQNKAHILEDIESLQQGLYKTKECVGEARTSVDLERCRELTKIKRFEEVQDKLFEMGMSREERRLRKSPREY